MTQIALPFMGLPGLTVSTGMAEGEHGPAPVGVQLVAARFREDLCLEAAEAIEARGVPPSPVTPRG
jgi:amidase